MAKYADLDLPEHPKLAHNITWFARALRKAGLPVGPGHVMEAIRAVTAVGFTQRADFYWTLHACFVSKPEHRAVFAQVFRLFWRDPRYMEHMISMLSPSVRGVQEERRANAGEKRAAEALLDGQGPEMPEPPAQEDGTEIEIDASQTASREEQLRQLDFEQMTGAEMVEARRMLAKLTLPVKPLLSRRRAPALAGRDADWRQTLRQSARRGGDIHRIATRERRPRWPNLVALCDISGSMAQYSRAVLHFLHSVANAKGQGWAKVHSFTFGTRLTNITRHLRQREVDAALAAAGREAQDWEGGTRIGDCLHRFNRDWSRRVLGQGAVVLLITDGLDREDPELLRAEMERLHLSSRQLLWINPLLRFDGFAARAQGVQAMLAHVDGLYAGHNIASLGALAEALSQPTFRGDLDRLKAQKPPAPPEQPEAPKLPSPGEIAQRLLAGARAPKPD